MANEISSMVTSLLAPAPAQKSVQFVELDTVAVSVPVPVSGNTESDNSKELMEQSESLSANSQDLQQAVDQINHVVQAVRRDLAFSLDEGSGRTVIKVVDSESGQLVRQIPSEEVLALASHLKEVQESADASSSLPSGILFSDKT